MAATPEAAQVTPVVNVASALLPYGTTARHQRVTFREESPKQVLLHVVRGHVGQLLGDLLKLQTSPAKFGRRLAGWRATPLNGERLLPGFL
jgi:hypothetical protein